MPIELIFSSDAQTSLLSWRFYPVIVMMSVLVSMMSGVLTVYLANVVRTVQNGLQRDIAHATGVLALGAGLWSTQFLSLHASAYEVSDAYDISWLLASVLTAAGIAWIAMDQLVRSSASVIELVFSSVLMMMGIAAMQYLIINGMQMQVSVHYDVWRTCVWLGAVLAVCFGLLRWNVAQSVLGNRKNPQQRSRQLIAGACAGLAVAGTEYLGFLPIQLSEARYSADAADALHYAIETVIGALLLLISVIVVHVVMLYRQMSQTFYDGQTRAQLLMSASQEGLLVLNSAYMIVSANRAVCHLFGRTEDELKGRSVNTLMSEFPVAFSSGWHDSFSGLGAALTSATKADVAPAAESRELFAEGSDGRIFPVRVSVRRSEEADHAIIVIAIHDMSSERESLRRERDAKSELCSVMSALTEHTMLSETDSAGNIIRVNDAFVAASGYSKSQLIGHPHSIVGTPVHPPAVWDSMWQSLREGKSWRHEICNRTPAGETYWLDTVIIPVLDEQSRLRRIIGLHQDITEQKNRLATQRLKQHFFSPEQLVVSQMRSVQ